MRFRERLSAVRHGAGRRIFRTISRNRHRRLVVVAAHGAQQYLEAFHFSSGDARHNGENDLLERLASTDALTIVDCGANVGSWTLAARRTFPNSTIHAFEPVHETSIELRRATAGDRLIVVHERALSDRAGTATMSVDDDDRATASLSSMHTGQGRRTFDVTLVTGDDAAREHSIDHVHVLKIDAEGHDLAVLEGFSVMIGKRLIDVVQFEVSGWNAVTRTWIGQFFELLEPAGYVVGRVVPHGVELGPYAPSLEDFRSTGNFVAVRSDDGALVARVAGSSARRP